MRNPFFFTIKKMLRLPFRLFIRSSKLCEAKFLLDTVNKPVLQFNKPNQTQSTGPEKQKNTIDSNPSQNLIFTVPNVLTMSRIVSVPFINYFVVVGKHDYACALFLVSGITDFLDGYVARNFPNQKSHLGSILDPLADKLLIGSLTITLTLSHMLPLTLAALIISRDVLLILYSLYIRYQMVEKPVTLSKYVNVKKYSQVQIEPDMISKVNTAFQLALITLTLPSVMFDYHDSSFLLGLQCLTGATTIASSISYYLKRGSYKKINN